jgi:hypothetical protein
MTTGSALYLLMCLVTFGGFSAVLAYVSWQQSKLGPEMLSDPEPQPKSDHAVTA